MIENSSNKYFKTECIQGVMMLYLDYSIFLEKETFVHKNELLEFLDKIDSQKEIKTLVISNEHSGFSFDQFKSKWNSIFEESDYESAVLRVFRSYNQVFLRLKSLEKVIISVNSQPVPPMLFCFSMVADLRFVSQEFYLNNDNCNMLNIPKGGAIFTEYNLMYLNPLKLLFYTDKVFPKELYNKHIIDGVFDKEELKDKVLSIASRYNRFDYIEIEAVKIFEHKKQRKFELALQKEDEFLLTCIRKMKNKNK